MRIISNNYILNATLTPSTANNLFPLSNLQNILRSKRFRFTSKDDQDLVIDLGSALDVDSFVLLLPKEGTLNLSGSETIKLQANDTDVWTSPSVDITLSRDTNSRQVSHYFSSTQNYRYWRLTIDDPSATGDYIEISKLILGQSDAITNTQNGFKFGKTDGTKISRNDFGTAYSDKFPQLKKLDLNYNNLYVSEVEVIDAIFELNGSHTPIFAVLDHLGTLFDKDTYSIYGLMDNNFNQTHISYNLLNTSGVSVTELN